MNNRIYWMAVLSLLFATTAWGGLFHVGKWALQELDPYWFTAVRYCFAALFVFIISLFIGRLKWSILKQNWFKLTIYGVLGYGVFGVLVFVGLSMSVPSHGAVIMATMPISSLVIGWVYDNQPVKIQGIFIALIALLGVGLVSGAWGVSDSSQDVTIQGDIIALIGTLGWIFYSRAQKGFTNISVFEFTAFTTFLAFPIIILFAVCLSLFGLSSPPTVSSLVSVTPAMMYVVIFATVLSGVAFNFGVRNLGAHQGIVFINFVPISAWIISLLLGQVPSGNEMLGTTFVIISLLVHASITKYTFLRLAVKAS